MARVLVLAGTTEATRLAGRLDATGVDVISSLAGVTSAPRHRPGRVRTGGFGGIDGLVRYLHDERIDVLLDATHPFAARMPFHAAAACERAHVPRCRVLRPPWEPAAGDRWIAVPDLTTAVAAVRELGARRVFLTTGRQRLREFAACADLHLVVRAIDAPVGLPDTAVVVLDRGPFDVEAERALIASHSVEVVVTKNSGGDAAAAKLEAARRAGVPVVVIERPAPPAGPVAPSVDEAMRWLATMDAGSP